MDTKTVFRRNPAAAWQQVEDNIVVVTPQTRKIHILSGCGVMIWQLLERPQSQEEIVRALLEEFEVERGVADKETRDFIAELQRKDIIMAASYH